MEIKNFVSKDVWSVISDNYDKESYTVAITNLIQYANEIVREKSGLSFDNTTLMDKAFLGQNPKLKINKFQTDTEKNIQAGVGYLLKGLCLAIRNPRAHERYNDNKETADKLIMFIDFILEFIRNSKQPTLVEDWLEFVFDENFNNTKEYAEIVLREIPEKNRYDLLVNIFRNRERAKPNSLNNLINVLLDVIKSEEINEFIDNLNKELLYCSDDTSLKMFFSLFPPQKWKCVTPLAKLRIENIVQKSIEEGRMIYEDFGTNMEEYTDSNEGSLSTWAKDFINFFDTKDKIVRILSNKLSNESVHVRNFVITYFKNIIYDEELIKSDLLKYGIKKSLKYYDRETYEIINFFYYFVKDEEIKAVFEKEYELAKEYFESDGSDQELPF